MDNHWCIELIYNICTSSKFWLAQEEFVSQKKTESTSTVHRKTILQSKWSTIFAYAQNSNFLKQEFLSGKKTGSAQQAYPGKKLHSNWSRIFPPAQNSNCLKQVIGIRKQNRRRAPCVPNKTICNHIEQVLCFLSVLHFVLAILSVHWWVLFSG